MSHRCEKLVRVKSSPHHHPRFQPCRRWTLRRVRLHNRGIVVTMRICLRHRRAMA